MIQSGFRLIVERDWFWFWFWFYYALWLASVFTLVLVLRQSSENCSTLLKKQLEIYAITGSCLRVPFLVNKWSPATQPPRADRGTGEEGRNLSLGVELILLQKQLEINSVMGSRWSVPFLVDTVRIPAIRPPRLQSYLSLRKPRRFVLFFL